jgi:hypothetical protein
VVNSDVEEEIQEILLIVGAKDGDGADVFLRYK